MHVTIQCRHLQQESISPESLESVAAGLDKLLNTTPGLSTYTILTTTTTTGIAMLPHCLPLALAALQSPLPSVRTIGASQLGAMLHVCSLHANIHPQRLAQHLGTNAPQRDDALHQLLRALGDVDTGVAQAAQQAVLRTVTNAEGLAAVTEAIARGALAAVIDSDDTTLRLRGLSFAAALVARQPGRKASTAR